MEFDVGDRTSFALQRDFENFEVRCCRENLAPRKRATVQHYRTHLVVLHFVIPPTHALSGNVPGQVTAHGSIFSLPNKLCVRLSSKV
jgi:hypothetical protein